MNILVITQIIDPQDYVFGYFYGHILDFAASSESVTVLCLEHRGGEFPENVTVHSLGKERGASRLQYAWRFYTFLFLGRSRYDTVFVHMEPLYILMGWPYWVLSGKRIILWYNHVYYDWKLKIAAWFADMIVGVSKKTIPVQHRNVRLLTHADDLPTIINK